ncbi:MAG: hypothetical protein GY696_37855, partial [Gammaproteobacteria bacterium]|nr:hypothetical protein [Gammaproteobacteria bacterium]
MMPRTRQTLHLLVINNKVLLELLTLKETLADVVIVEPKLQRDHLVEGHEAEIAVEESLKAESVQETIDGTEGVPEIVAGRKKGTGIGQGSVAGQGAGIEIPATRESSGKLILGIGVETQGGRTLWITTLGSKMSLETTGTSRIILVQVAGIKDRHGEVQVVVVAVYGTGEEILIMVDVTGLMLRMNMMLKRSKTEAMVMDLEGEVVEGVLVKREAEECVAVIDLKQKEEADSEKTEVLNLIMTEMGILTGLMAKQKISTMTETIDAFKMRKDFSLVQRRG